MRIIKPSVEIEYLNPKRIIKNLEKYGRKCYLSEPKGDPNKFVADKIKLGHESIIEHEKATVIVVCDRGVTHEIVRHRVASYSQESTRYCNYAQEKFGSEITVVDPFFFDFDKKLTWKNACEDAEKAYFELMSNNWPQFEKSVTPQEARSVLPNSLKTEIVVTFNMREWRHFFKLRCSAKAHPQMRQVAIPLLIEFKLLMPALFGDIEYDREFPAEHYAKVIMKSE